MEGRHARDLLGVNDGAGTEEIQRAFRECVRLTHPDHGGDRAAFEQVVLAFETLQASPVSPHAPRALAPARPSVDLYDSVRRPPRRDFADVLQAALAQA
jgi:hypothetical protein